MEGDIVALLENLVPVLHQLDVLGQALLLSEGVVGQHGHVKAQGGLLGHQLADVAQAHQAQGLALQLGLGDAHLGLAVVLQVQLLDLLEVPGAVEHVEDGQLGHRNGVGPAGGAHQHPVLPGGGQVHPVVAGAVAGQDLQLGGGVKDALGDLGGADDDGVTVLDVRDDVLLRKAPAVHRFIAVFPQILIASRKNRLGEQYPNCHTKLLLVFCA